MLKGEINWWSSFQHFKAFSPWEIITNTLSCTKWKDSYDQQTKFDMIIAYSISTAKYNSS